LSRMSPGQKILRIRGPGAAAVRPAPSFLLIRGIHRRPPGSQANRGMIGTRRGLKFIPDEGPSGGGLMPRSGGGDPSAEAHLRRRSSIQRRGPSCRMRSPSRHTALPLTNGRPLGPHPSPPSLQAQDYRLE